MEWDNNILYMYVNIIYIYIVNVEFQHMSSAGELYQALMLNSRSYWGYIGL